MFYYIDTIEQVKDKDDETKINEYGKREIHKLPLEQVLSKYYKKLSDVSADLVTIDDTKKHYYMDIRITDSTGGVIKKDVVGKLREQFPESETNLES